MKYVLFLVIVFACVVAGAFLYAWSGAYNIAATQPHWRVTKSLIDLAKDRSIETHSEDIQVPAVGEAEKDAAFSQYHEMCRLCHGAPEFPPLEFAKGFYPSPPSLIAGDIQQEFGKAQIYWIAKHGIKMTGMPAFGPTHSEQELWGLAALVEEMPQMTPDQYRQAVKKAEQEHGESNHGHGETQ